MKPSKLNLVMRDLCLIWAFVVIGFSIDLLVSLVVDHTTGFLCMIGWGIIVTDWLNPEPDKELEEENE